ncbi:MAG TPA: DNA-3-methyladenine glycosylase [Acetobacteraceae bacterium]|nr:DNA-3-methyladenine glycosylase [Acetobacteraceae bacterium]
MPASRHIPSAHLCATDPAMAELIARIGRCGLRTVKREPFEALLHAVAHQQLHARAAEAILGRFHALFPEAPFPAPEAVLATPEASLRACGFSGTKVAAIRDLCAKATDGTVPTRRACPRLSDDELIERLTTIRGVGRWTVEMLLIFTLGRPDILPVDDFGIREGYRLLHDLPAQPKPRELAEIGTRWGPHRSTAAWYLWRAAEGSKRAAPA